MSTTVYASGQHHHHHHLNAYSPSSAGTTFANAQSQSMDGRQGADYPQPGSHTPSTTYTDPRSEASSRASDSVPPSAQYTPSQQQDAKFAHQHQHQQQHQQHSAAATPTSEYSLNPSSARSGSFPDYITQRGYPDGSQRYHPASAQGAGPGNMAQPQSPSVPSAQPPVVVDAGHGDYSADAKPPSSNTEVPVDPSIAASSPTYPPQHHYSPYPNQHEMGHYQAHPGMYRPEYGGYPGGHPHHQVPYGHVGTSMSTPPSMVSAAARPPGGGHPLSTVYSFVPIPGTHQQKRPRRRYEEIERMYKCGWNGCEKAYGTLNHLNAHVTMQGHGSKRTPEEFKEIRKEWKARKKEEDQARKAEEERARQHVQQTGQVDGQQGPDPQQPGQPPAPYGQGVRQLPPLNYAPAGGQVPAQYGQPGGQMEGMPSYSSGPMQSYAYPQSPYGQNQMYYSQHHPTAAGQSEVAANQKPADDAPPS